MLLKVLIAFAYFSSVISATCYTLDGHDHNSISSNKTGTVFKPCRPDGVSMCCAVGSGNGDICLPSGVCYNDRTQKYTRRSCTDQTWKDQACVKLFMNSTTIRGSTNSRRSSNATDVDVTPCGDGTWCYGSNQESIDCCVAGDGVKPLFSTDMEYDRNSTMIAKVAVDEKGKAVGNIDAEVKAEVNKDSAARWGIMIGVATIVAVIVVVTAFAIKRCTGKRKQKKLKASIPEQDQQCELKPEMGIPTPRIDSKMDLQPGPPAEMGMVTPKMGVEMQLEPPAAVHTRYELEG